MSCILYSKGSYNQLEKNSQTTREIFAPLSVSDFLFELNADAYRVRYEHIDDISEEINGARLDTDGDHEFHLKDWNDPKELRDLFGRISYQCSDIYDRGEEAADPDHVARYQVLEAAISELERRANTPAYQLEQKRKAEAERQQQGEQKTVDKERIISELREKYPWAKAQGKSSDYARAASNLKKELSLAFPGVKFSVRSESYSMGNAVRVSWFDGPTQEEVDKIANKYQGGHFDGMTDCYDYDSSAYGEAVYTVLGRAKYVSTSRHFSPRFLRDCVLEVCFEYGHHALPLVKTSDYDGSAWLEGGQVPLCPGGDAYGYNSLHDAILRHAHQTSMVKQEAPKAEAATTAQGTAQGYTVTPSGSWTWVKFDAKPQPSIIASLKAAGAKWSKKRGAWYFSAPVALAISDDVVTISAR